MRVWETILEYRHPWNHQRWRFGVTVWLDPRICRKNTEVKEVWLEDPRDLNMSKISKGANIFWSQTSTGCIPFKTSGCHLGLFFVCAFFMDCIMVYQSRSFTTIWYRIFVVHFYQVSEVKQKKSELFFADIAVWLRWNHDWMSCSSTKVSIDPQTPQDVNTLQQNLSQKTYELEALKKSYSQVDGDKLEMLWTPNWVNWGTS